ncbi:MAG: hypothetical protein WC812_04540 [Candidatus Pacearchaeota archaeon]|jgi:hypothetical protein
MVKIVDKLKDEEEQIKSKMDFLSEFFKSNGTISVNREGTKYIEVKQNEDTLLYIPCVVNYINQEQIIVKSEKLRTDTLERLASSYENKLNTTLTLVRDYVEI